MVAPDVLGASFSFLSAVILFPYHFVLRLGVLDGSRGFQFAFLRATYFYLTDLKLIEYRRTGKRPAVYWPARGEPHPTLPKTLDADPAGRSD